MAKFTLKKVIILMAAILTIIGGAVFYLNLNKPFLKEANGFLKENIPEEVEKEVFLVIDDGIGAPKRIINQLEEGMTAFDLLKKKSEELNIVLKTKDSDFGAFIETIGDKENGESGKYWLYYVNGEFPMVAADKLQIKAGDVVEFKFEKSSF